MSVDRSASPGKAGASHIARQISTVWLRHILFVPPAGVVTLPLQTQVACGLLTAGFASGVPCLGLPVVFFFS